ncbi:MAG TPA: M48 family metallopeptidase [Burkholderiales bacterium]
MSFFEQQHLARRNSRAMVLLFLLSVVAIVLAVDLVLVTVYWWLGYLDVPASSYVLASVLTAAVIGVVSLFNIIRLAEGGATVARMVGARPVASATSDPLERRLLNIVEEMAIAAGVRLPQAYVMDQESGINAFAAGWNVSGTVVAVTRGALERLTRDELQAVIGHEFSHILNGDMALNIRMIGVLAGIVALGSIGGFLMRLAREGDDLRFAAVAFLIGLALFLIGYAGLFFARLIKAAAARQREYLADASSVQFTRNPEGIAGALDQIGASGAGTLIGSRYAEELSHMFFGASVKLRLARLFDTHPPLEERIRRACPQFVAADYRRRRAAAAISPASSIASPAPAEIAPSGRRAADLGTAWGRSAAQSANLVGNVTPAKMDYAGRLLAAIPGGLRACLHDAEDAAGVLIALLLAPKEDVMAQQLEALRNGGFARLSERAAAIAPLAASLPPAFHLPLIDLALPALKAAKEVARQELVGALHAAINADRRVSLHEFVVLCLVRQQLGAPQKRAAGTRRLADLQAEAAVLLSLVAHAGTRPDVSGARADALQAAVQAGASEMQLPAAPVLASVTLEQAGAALDALKTLAPLQKALLVKGLFAAVTADGSIRVAEAEIMRLVGASLDCPLPPLLDDYFIASVSEGSPAESAGPQR